jgi:flagellar basal body-associated protein FliL
MSGKKVAVFIFVGVLALVIALFVVMKLFFSHMETESKESGKAFISPPAYTAENNLS